MRTGVQFTDINEGHHIERVDAVERGLIARQHHLHLAARVVANLHFVWQTKVKLDITEAYGAGRALSCDGEPEAERETSASSFKPQSSEEFSQPARRPALLQRTPRSDSVVCPL